MTGNFFESRASKNSLNGPCTSFRSSTVCCSGFQIVGTPLSNRTILRGLLFDRVLDCDLRNSAYSSSCRSSNVQRDSLTSLPSSCAKAIGPRTASSALAATIPFTTIRRETSASSFPISSILTVACRFYARRNTQTLRMKKTAHPVRSAPLRFRRLALQLARRNEDRGPTVTRHDQCAAGNDYSPLIDAAVPDLHVHLTAAVAVAAAVSAVVASIRPTLDAIASLVGVPAATTPPFVAARFGWQSRPCQACRPHGGEDPGFYLLLD